MNFKTNTKSVLPSVSDEKQSQFNKTLRDNVATDLQAIADFDQFPLWSFLYLSVKRWDGSAWVTRTVYHKKDSGWATKNENDWFDDYTLPGWVAADSVNLADNIVPANLTTSTALAIFKRYTKDETR